MKRTERHRLKENEVARSVERARETWDVYRKPILTGLVAIALIVAAVAAVTAWRRGQDAGARAMLTEAMVIADAPVSPGGPGPNTPTGSYPSEQAKLEAALKKFMEAADAHPKSDPGIAARYHAASTLSALGRHDQAAQRYQEVMDVAGSGLYGEMARMGLAEAQAATGDYEKAVATYKELAERKDASLPIDGVLMQLGRTYERAGKTTEARQAFQRILDEFPQSPYASLATRELAQ
jgi:TolA-binding protein